MIAAILLTPTRYFNERGSLLQMSWLALCASLTLVSVCQGYQGVVRTSTPASTSAVSQPKWVQPIALLRDLESIEPFHLATHWAASTRQIIKQLEQCESLSDPDCLIVFDHLTGQLNQLEHLMAQVIELPDPDDETPSNELATRLSHIRYALERRLDIWQSVHKIANCKFDQIGDVSAGNIGDILTASSRKMKIGNIAPAWSGYLELDQAAAAFNSLNPDRLEQKKQARRVLARICSPSLSQEQRGYLASHIDFELLDLLKFCASDEINLERLLTRIERVEHSNTGGNLYSLNDDYHNLIWSGVPEHQNLAGHLQSHYRNANFRLTISERLLNKALPQIPDMQEPFREQIMGANVVGQNQISNELRIRLVPDPNQVQIRLETIGKVFSRTRAQRSGFTIHNEGSSRFQVIKALAFGRNGVVNGKPISFSSTHQRLTGMKSELDAIPVVGWMARKIAKQKIEQQAPKLERITKQKIESMARMEVDEQVETYLDLMRQYTFVNLLQPLIALELEPEPVETKTTEDDVVMRYRLAGRDQMGACSARPVPLENNLLSMQIHETAINNLLQRIELSGQPFSIPELKTHLQDVFSLPVSEPTDIEARAEAAFVFEAFDPLRVDFEEGGLAFTINLKSLRMGKKGKTWQKLSIRAMYYPEITGAQIVLKQDPNGISLRGKRLRLGDQIAIRTIFTSLFDKQYEVNALPEKLAERLGGTSFHIGQFVLTDGWVGISLIDPPAQSAVVAETPARRRLLTPKARR